MVEQVVCRTCHAQPQWRMDVFIVNSGSRTNDDSSADTNKQMDVVGLVCGLLLLLLTIVVPSLVCCVRYCHKCLDNDIIVRMTPHHHI